MVPHKLVRLISQENTTFIENLARSWFSNFTLIAHVYWQIFQLRPRMFLEGTVVALAILLYLPWLLQYGIGTMEGSYRCILWENIFTLCLSLYYLFRLGVTVNCYFVPVFLHKAWLVMASCLTVVLLLLLLLFHLKVQSFNSMVR